MPLWLYFVVTWLIVGYGMGRIIHVLEEILYEVGRSDAKKMREESDLENDEM